MFYHVQFLKNILHNFGQKSDDKLRKYNFNRGKIPFIFPFILYEYQDIQYDNFD